MRQGAVGSNITLRSQFIDENLNPIEATDVLVYIFEPGIDTSDITLAINYDSPGEPIYIGNGVFEFSYPIPADSEEGTWTDSWTGKILETVNTSLFTFSVINNGDIISFNNQLYNNNIIEITIDSSLTAADGSTLKEDYTFSFLTTTSPNYSSIRKVRLEYGGFLSNITDMTVQLGILEASLEANELNFSSSVVNQDLFNHARREWVTCKTGLTLINNLGSNLVKSKKLGDFAVTWDTNGIRDMANKALSCVEKWESQIIAGGGALSSQSPSSVIKGNYNPDKLIIGRTWCENSPYPAGNIKQIPNGSRRAKKTFRRSW